MLPWRARALYLLCIAAAVVGVVRPGAARLQPQLRRARAPARVRSRLRWVLESTSASADTRAAPEPTVASEFWERQWYPVMPLSYADEERPTAFNLLGRRMTLWKGSDPDGRDAWSACDDVCPHRLAPLSTGKVCDGTLVCRFHGWRFDSTGACVEVPMATNPNAAARLCGSAKTAVGSYPVRVVAGLVWVWPERADGAHARSAATELPLGADGAAAGLDWLLQVEPVSYESMLENAMDPSHAPYLHADSFSASPPVPMRQMRLAAPVEPRGFELEHSGYQRSNEGMNATRTFVAPAYVRSRYELPGGKVSDFLLFFVPAAPFETRTLVGFPSLSRAVLPKWAPAPLARAVGDLMHALFLASDGLWRFHDQDQFTMQGQDDAQLEAPHRPQAAFDVLTLSDTGVAAVRKWLAAVGGGPFGAVPGGGAAPVRAPDELGRWNTHGKHCPQCRKAVRTLDALSAWAGRGAVAASLAIAALACAGRLAASLSAASAALVLYGAARWADQARRAYFGKEKELWLPSVYK